MEVRFRKSIDLGLKLDEPGNLAAIVDLGLEKLYAQPIRLSHWQLAHYAAVESWLLDYCPKTDATGIEKMRGYLEAIQHLVEVEDWQRAAQLFMVPLPFDNGRQSVCDRLYSKEYFYVGWSWLQHQKISTLSLNGYPTGS